jgi:hypothetical protein
MDPPAQRRLLDAELPCDRGDCGDRC